MNYLKITLIKKMFSNILVVLTCIIIFCGCGFEKVQEETQLCKEAKEEAKQVFEYLKEEDTSSLSNFFSQKALSDCNLEEEWKIFLEQINGKIIDYETIETFENRRTFSDGNLTYLLLRIEFKNVKTDTGQVYEKMRYSKTAKCDSDPDKEGINWLELMIDGNEKNYQISH
ncbi:DUF5104 domain-containing protein [Ruminococcus sp. HUN007]|uniref:DUF5104 domain-containing protein n=1 Tax=Ruminococcus sp. HUN007 TaxID=1514668 RepID=UPI0005D1AC50|nr:DUF5104 domain-containing protein [Ruminococcus sp. HUN007]